MECANCRSEEVAYTLTTYPEDDGMEHVDLHFCSADCLNVWA
ncbi:hypothetical protein SAMN05444422_103385 [Halobiforma haloterrestris]|uniref:Uncharacterized protein n=2 Tax=Natronobacterium TaxID=2256 RepID=M0LC76_NATLA|nr:MULTISPECIES: hypothetical protein [Halobiforma]EMA31172.1 hypothetical protein C445_14734 [Halobiforma lacisalsi AJ5]SFB99036.1 hypothetical protein SAMN05444422_103385 [Halobiforma haloterrestris]